MKVEEQLKIAVIGLGYVGLPLCMLLTKKGYSVMGIDYNAEWVKTVNAGKSNIIDVSSKELQQAIKSGLFTAETEYKYIKQAEVIIICVPTPLNEAKEPDLTCIMQAVEGMMPYLNKGVLISLESTTYPGTTDELIVERIEKEKGWTVGKDFYACYSPERVDPGNKQFSVGNTPKVVGGATPACLQKGKQLYESILPFVVGVKSTREAEMTKLLENTFRCVNIALMNEMTMMCDRMNIDIWEVIKGAGSKPFGFLTFYPGPGVGGHCIPLDPLYLSWEARKYNYFSKFIETASDINSNMPYYVILQVLKILSRMSRGLKESKILLMGMSYKKDISDVRESPSLEVYELLIEGGAAVDFYDPYVSSVKTKGGRIDRVQFTEEVVEQYDLVIILTDHSNVNYNWLINHSKAVYDTRNVCKEIESNKVIKLGQNIEALECRLK